MNQLQKLLLALTIIFFSIAIGYIFQRVYLHYREKDALFEGMRNFLQKAAIFFLMPASAMLSLWGMPKPQPSLFILPLTGTVSYILGGFFAIWLGKLMELSQKQLGSYYGCGAFTNLGAVGGLVCLVFLGENTIALVALYRLLEEIYFFGVAFPVAKSFASEDPAARFSLRQFMPNPGVGIIVLALGLGIILNLKGIKRPENLSIAASAFMYMATISLLAGIGMNLRFSAIGKYLRPALALCLVKFVLLPFCITGISCLLGAGGLENGLVLKTIFILSAMPVAMYALVPPALFGLDVDLANACWLVTTLALIIVIPALIICLPYI